jgi:hypothetical protein
VNIHICRARHRTGHRARFDNTPDNLAIVLIKVDRFAHKNAPVFQKKLGLIEYRRSSSFRNGGQAVYRSG